MAPPIPQLLDALYREDVKRALAMSPGGKFLEGPRLFARACRVMADGIRHRHPELDDDAVAVIDALERNRVPYMVVGSLASNCHGIRRATADLSSYLERSHASRRSDASIIDR